MSAAIVAGVLTAIPWKELFQHGPSLLNSARGLFNKSREQDAKESLEERVARLERNEKEQSQLIAQLVERQELLLSAIQVINSRLKALFIGTLVTAVGLVACIAVLLFR